MGRRWRRLFCRCRIVACRFFSGECRAMPQRSQSTQRRNFGLLAAASELRSDWGLAFRSLLCGLCVLCGELFLHLDRAMAEVQDVVLIEGAAFRGVLVSIDAEGNATFRIADAKGDGGSTRVVA